MTVPVTQITPTGPVVPTYNDVLVALQSAFLGIFGSDSYIAPDSKDGQLLAVFAQAISDCNNQIAQTYLQFSPATATGVGLDYVVKVNGIRRNSAGFSTVPLVITGTPCIIPAGIVADDLGLGTQWALPLNTAIPNSGTVTVTATCTTKGGVIVPANHITTIAGGAVPGWQSVNNLVASTPGATVETDMQLRQRQTISTAIAALTPLDTIISAVANVAGVVRYAIYENDTNSWDNHGIPPHSVALVVEGGSVSDVVDAIARTKNPGTGSYGTTSQVVTDSAGVANTINYMQLSQIPITVNVTLRALTGYASTTTPLVQDSIVQYLNGLAIGEISYLDRLRATALLKGDDATLATGFTQPQLDALSNTFIIASITQSRANNPAVANAVGGPFAPGSVNIVTSDAAQMYATMRISVTLDDGSQLATSIDAIVDNTITLHDAVPAGRNILAGAAIVMTDNIMCLFYEACQGDAANVNITVV